ncbi:MAG: ACP S-malonyltransferase [Hyphomicrobiaceae bacterium]
MSNAFIFPGQGSQEVGMGQALADAFPVAKAVFDEVDDALGEKLSDLMRDGPQDELTLTQNAQPALMAVSMAVVRVLESELGITVKEQAKFVAGHSLGEYSALAAAGTFSIADAAQLLRTRGLAMQAAVPVGEGAMAALLGVGLDVAKTVAEAAVKDGEVLQIANDNEPTQVVLSGSKTAVDRIQEIGKEHGVRRAVPLPVSAPFHCALMKPAADIMAEALANATVNAPVVPVVANVTAGPLSDPEEIKSRLVEQVTGTVRWRECVLAMTGAGVTNFYELGCGKVLSGLARRIEKTVSATPVGSPDDLKAVEAALKG